MPMQLAMPGFELPSWAFRRATAPELTPPSGIFDLLADAAALNRFTGSAARIGVYLPDDVVPGRDGAAEIAACAASLGLTISSVYPTVNLGHGRPPGVCSADMWVRRRAVAALRDAAALVGELGASQLVLRFTDDSRYPGREEFEARKVRLFEALYDVCSQLPPGGRLVVDYQVAQPAGFSGAPDWRTMRDLCVAADDRAKVLVDTTAVVVQGDPISELATAGRLGGVVLGGLPNDAFGFLHALAEVAAAHVNSENAVVALDPTAWLAAYPDDGLGGLIDFMCVVQEQVARVKGLELGDCAALGARLGAAFVSPLPGGASRWLSQARSAAGAPRDPRKAFYRACQGRYVTSERRAAAAHRGNVPAHRISCDTRRDEHIPF